MDEAEASEKPKKKRKLEKWTPRTIGILIEKLVASQVHGVYSDGEYYRFPKDLIAEMFEALTSSAKQLDALKKRLSWMFVMSKKRGG